MRTNDGKQLYCQCGKAAYSQKEVFIRLNYYRKYKHGNSKSKKPIRAYRCEFCGHWHLTSQEKRKKYK